MVFVDYVSVNRIYIHKERITEGELRCKQLLEYLEKSNASKSVFLSEDASGIVKRVVYDSKSNQMIGLVLPMNEKNGMPQVKTFIAESAEKMKEYLRGPESTLVYIVAAQPLKDKTPPFILQIFGTNNKFDMSVVSKRWKYTIDELKKLALKFIAIYKVVINILVKLYAQNIFRFGINVVGISSDGDPRLLSTMKSWTSFDSKPSTTPSTSAITTNSMNQKPYLIQDTIHIGTKLRNRILNSSIVLHIGTKIVSTVHIKTLLKTVTKEVHGLVLSDIIPEDRQNYNSLEKIMDDRVLNAMKTHVPDSEGTIMYLTLCKLITSSFTATNLKPIDRIYNIWYAVYFLRCWRNWLKSNNDYSLEENFISYNAYTCIEINAQNLIEIVVKLRSNGHENLFLPELFASQPCEHIFRMMRSMGTINFTKINFSLSEILHMIARLELMQKTIFTHENIVFPRISKEAPPDNMQKLPSDNEIQQAMESAQGAALEKAALFGIFLAANDIASTGFSQKKPLSIVTSSESGFETNFENDELDNDELENENVGDDEQVIVKNTSDVASSPLLHFIDPDGTTRTVRKSTFIWMHTEEKDKLSSDRLKRVQGSSSSVIKSDTKRRKKSSLGVSEPSSEHSLAEGGLSSETNLVKSDEIMIGDWVIFDLRNEKIPSNLEDEIAMQNGQLIGLLTGFRYINKDNRSLQYKADFVSLKKNQEKKVKIMVLGIWYSCNENGLLNQIPRNLSFEIESYKCTMKSPIIKSESDSVRYILPFQYSELKNSHLDSHSDL